MINFDTITDNVRWLLLNGCLNYSNHNLVKAYYKHFDLSMTTPAESITRCKRKLVELAKKAEHNGCVDPWVKRLIPSNERLEIVRIEEGHYKNNFGGK